MFPKVLAVLLIATVAIAQYVGWFPPYAQLITAYPQNATLFTAYVESTPLYIAQEGLSFVGSEAEASAALQYLQQICRFVAVDVHNASSSDYGELWIGDIYCSPDGSSWFWLKWLPLRFTAYVGDVEMANVSATVKTPIGNFTGLAPAGWYLDPVAKAVVRLPGNTSLLDKYRELVSSVEALKTQVASLARNKTSLESAFSQLQAQVKQLEEARRSLEAQLKARESYAAALEAENKALKAQISQLQAENARLREQAANLTKQVDNLTKQLEDSKSLVNSLKSQLDSLTAKLQTENSLDLTPFYITATVAGAVAAFFVVRKRREG